MPSGAIQSTSPGIILPPGEWVQLTNGFEDDWLVTVGNCSDTKHVCTRVHTEKPSEEVTTGMPLQPMKYRDVVIGKGSKLWAYTTQKGVHVVVEEQGEIDLSSGAVS